jgi:hypothetical protein
MNNLCMHHLHARQLRESAAKLVHGRLRSKAAHCSAATERWTRVQRHVGTHTQQAHGPKRRVTPLRGCACGGAVSSIALQMTVRATSSALSRLPVAAELTRADSLLVGRTLFFQLVASIAGPSPC